jgi:hypothetical protein
MKDKIPELELAINGYITLKIIKSHFEDLKHRKAELEAIITKLAKPYMEEVDLILTAPYFKNTFTAITIISEIGVNMDVFLTAKRLCSWTQLTPTNNESAGNKKFLHQLSNRADHLYILTLKN